MRGNVLRVHICLYQYSAHTLTYVYIEQQLLLEDLCGKTGPASEQKSQRERVKEIAFEGFRA